MTNAARIWYPNTTYHVTARGNRRNDIFKDDEDFQVYLEILQEALEYYKNDYEIICYCLMDNHVHLMIKTKDRHLKYFVTRVNSIYAKFFNDKYNYIGHLYQDRYFSELIESDAHMLDSSRYIHLNPVKAHMVKLPAEYRWSSFNEYIGNSSSNFINSKEILQYFRDDCCRELYRKFVEDIIIEDK